MSGVSAAEVLETIAKLIREIGVEVGEVRAEQQLETDLGLESLMRVELATKLQKIYRKPLIDHVDRFGTIGDLLDHLVQA